MSLRSTESGFFSAAVLAFSIAFLGARVDAVDFLRGDANGDRKITLADAHTVFGNLFFGLFSPECRNAMDADDDGNANLTDAVKLTQAALRPDLIAAPFPAVGPDPTPGPGLTCDDYGNGGPLADPGARIEVLDAVAAGGADGTAVIRIAVSHSTRIAGVEGVLDIAGNPTGSIEPSGFDSFFGTPIFPKPTDLTTPPGGETHVYLYSAPRGDGLAFGYLRWNTDDWGGWLEPGTDAAVLSFTVCIEDGTPAGEYPLDLSSGALVDVDTGRSINAELAGGTLTVSSAVSTGHDCYAPKNVDCPPETGRPADLSANFTLTGGAAPPGGTVEVPFNIQSNAETAGFTVSIDYDEEVIEGVGLEPSWQKPDGSRYAFWVYSFYNDNAVPGNAGVDEGYFIAAAVFSLTDNCNNIPRDQDTEVLRLKLRVRPEATPGSSEIRFLDGGRQQGPPAGGPIKNSIGAFGETVTADVASSFVFVDGFMHILADGSLFVRGDSNRDGKVDLSDAVKTLNHLFLTGGDLLCADAGDANDDGRIDVSDAVATLNWLYLGAPALPPPNGAPGDDPTPDSLRCYGEP